MSGLVALTGGTGFIGSTILKRLTGEGWRVRALTRRDNSSPLDRVEWIPGDLDDRAALKRLADHADAVIHCAGVVRGSSSQAFTHVNVDGTRNLVDAAADQDTPPRFLLVSSLAAREPQLSWYASSKRGAEDTLRDHAGSMPWTIFRPSAVYGPGDREMRPLLKSMKRGFLVLPGCPGGRFGLLHIRDLTDAVCAWLRSPGADGGVFELDDGTPGGYGAQSLTRIAEDVRGGKITQIAVPGGVLYAFAGVNLILSRVFRYTPMLTPGKVRELLHPDWICNNEPFSRVSRWQPRIRLADALLDNALFAA